MVKRRRRKRDVARVAGGAAQQRPPARPAEAPSSNRVRGWRVAFLVLCTIGVCLSADLLRLHVNVHTNPDYRSYCAMSASSPRAFGLPGLAAMTDRQSDVLSRQLKFRWHARAA